MEKAYSVGGYHPVDGSFAYAACECFVSEADALLWQREYRLLHGGTWSATTVTATPVPDGTLARLPPVSEMIDRLKQSPARAAS